MRARLTSVLRSVRCWIDDEALDGFVDPAEEERVEWPRILPFMLLHLSCLGVLWVGWSWTAVAVAAILYAVRMFALTAVYHRYFSHKTYKMSRTWQFLFGILGSAAAQRGPLWWAAHHREHHRSSDKPDDPHSPVQKGFLWSHMGWFTTRKSFLTRWELVRDWEKFPELRLLNRFSTVVPLLLILVLYIGGELLQWALPKAGTNGFQLVIWGFSISTVVLFHAVGTINSLDHLIGKRRYETDDHSRNNWLLALITFGEGWHNNHHHYSNTVRQGFFWWELDLSHYLLVILSWMGITRDLRPLPATARRSNLIRPETGGADTTGIRG